MDYLANLEEHLKTVIYSAYLHDEKPISTLILAAPEDGKTSCLKQFEQNKGLYWLQKATTWGICDKVLKKIVDGEVKHLVLPDLTILSAMNSRGQTDLISFLNALIEEGTAEINTFYVRSQAKAKCGLITAITSENFNRHRKVWQGMGFLSRLMIFSYSYSTTAVQNLFQKFFRQESRESKFLYSLPLAPQKIYLDPARAEKINSISLIVGNNTHAHGFRFQLNAQAWLKAHALSENRTEVSDADVERFVNIANWFNFSCNPVQ